MAALRSRLLHPLLRTCGQTSVRTTHRTFMLHAARIPHGDTSRHICVHCRLHQRLRTVHLPLARLSSSTPTQEPTTSPSQSSPSSPFTLVQKELDCLTDDIHRELTTGREELQQIAQYYFDGKGKAFRPMVVLLMSGACNSHNQLDHRLMKSQQQIAMISEMIHTASLVHDDVIDAADLRRGKASINSIWGQRKAILAGDYILGVSTQALARLRNEEVVNILSQVIEDLVRGEFMQLGSKEDENARFSHYLKKTFKKTASLLANSCKAVAVLGNCSEEIAEIAYQYGKNVGIAFQLVDDLLDFTSCESAMGKPTAADLKLGLATAPVLFAAQQYPELNAMIMRRFTHEGDVERARYLVEKSEGKEETRMLAEQYSKEAVRQISMLQPSPWQAGLVQVSDMVLQRNK